jgi:hypothetical protein
LLAVCTAALAAGPTVSNPSFEADRYGNWPGYARGNGGTIAGWQWKGSAGINPIWREGGRPDHAFSDNGRVPNGRQVAFLQNVAELRQSVAGFEKGTRYRVTYWENARHNNAPTRNPRLKVTLGGETVVSEHRIGPVEAIGHRTLPYHYVESAVFTARRDGAFTLVFHTTFGDRVAVLLDRMRIVEVK